MYRPEDLIFRQNITFEKSWAYRLKDKVTVIPLDGLEARFRLAVSHEADDALIDVSSPSASITVDGPEGRVSMRISATVTDDLPVGKDYVWVVELFDPDDPTENVHFIDGRAQVKPRVPG